MNPARLIGGEEAVVPAGANAVEQAKAPSRRVETRQYDRL